MKYIIILSSFIIFFSCQEKKTSSTIQETVKRVLPANISAVMTQHGGFDNWNSWKGLSYEIVNKKGNEKQIVDLQNRRERIEGPDFKMGFNGQDFWLEADTTYKGNPVFYKNLMFYFYAMPFVLGDEGIVYSKTNDLEFEGQKYPGIKVGYKSNVGVSPEDEYFIHYNPKSKQMEWLGYTVTYFSKEKSSNIKWIRYNDWSTVNGMLLPKSIDWYKSEEGVPTEFRNKVEFAEIKLLKEAFPDETFAKTAASTIVKKD